MSDLETVLLCAFAFMTFMHFRQRSAIRELRCIIIDVGLDKARIEVEEDNHIVRIIRK